MDVLFGCILGCLGLSKNDDEEGEAKHRNLRKKGNCASYCKGLLDIAHEASIKEADQMSPLLVYRLPLIAQLLLVCTLIFTFWGAFLYVVWENIYNCSEQNGCLSCSITSDPSGKCTQISQSSLPMTSSCVSFSPLNVYKDFDDAVGVDIIDQLPKQVLKGLSKKFIKSFNLHRKAWECFPQNDLKQLQSPDVKCIVNFLEKYYLYPGFVVSNLDQSDKYGGANEKSVVAAGIRLLQNLYCLSAILYTTGLQSSIVDQSTTYAVTDAVTGVEWQVFVLSECVIYGRDGSYGSLSPEVYSCDKRIGGADDLHQSLLVIPTSYLLKIDEVIALPRTGDGRIFPGEALRVTVEPDEFLLKLMTMQTIKDDVAHCIQASSLANTYSTYESGLYRCCTEATTVEVLSQAGALASFALTLSVIATTVLLYVFQRRAEGEKRLGRIEPEDLSDDDAAAAAAANDVELGVYPTDKFAAYSNVPAADGGGGGGNLIGSEVDAEAIRGAQATTESTSLEVDSPSAAFVKQLQQQQQTAAAPRRHTAAPQLVGSIESNRRRRSSLTSNVGW